MQQADQPAPRVDRRAVAMSLIAKLNYTRVADDPLQELQIAEIRVGRVDGPDRVRALSEPLDSSILGRGNRGQQENESNRASGHFEIVWL